MNKEKIVIDEERIIEDMKRYAPNTQYDAHDYSRYGNEIRLEFLIQDALGLIYSLQDENRQLLEKSNDLRDELIGVTCDLGNAKELIEQQKAEIERLTEEIDQRREMMHRMDCNYATELQKNAELQKQVDELKKRLHWIWAIGVDYDGCDGVESLKELIDELVELTQIESKDLDEYFTYNTTQGGKMNILDIVRKIERKDTAKEILLPLDEITKTSKTMANLGLTLIAKICSLKERYGVGVE